MNKQHEILPAGITKRNGRYRVSRMVDGVRRTGTRDTLDGAIKLSDLFKNGSWDEDDEIVASGYQSWTLKEALSMYVEYRKEKLVRERTDIRTTEAEKEKLLQEKGRHFKWYAKFLATYFGPRERLDDLTTRKVMKLQDHLIKERKYAASTINYLNSLLVGCQNFARKRGRMNGKALGMEWQKKATKREVVISFEQEELMLSWASAMCHDLFGDMITFYLNSGCRMREAFGLRWRDINYFNKTFSVGLTKNGKNRTIPFGDTPIEDIFERLQSKSKQHQNDKVFKGINEKKLYRLWWQMRDECDIGSEYKIHTMRHTYCSRLVAAGIDLRTVQQIMGHHSLEVTQGYSHFMPFNLKGVGSGLERLRDKAQDNGPKVVNLLKVNTN